MKRHYLRAMLWSQYILCGALASIISIILPGMLNMTVVSMSIEKGMKAAMRFSVGSGIIFVVYASMALFLSDFLGRNPAVFEQIKIVILIILLVLAVVYFVKARQPAAIRTKKETKGHPFTAGIFVTIMNAMLLPYFFAVGAYLETKGLMEQQRSATLLFSLGAGAGAVLSFALYARFAQFIAVHAVFIARNINYIIAILFLVLAVAQLGDLLGWY